MHTNEQVIHIYSILIMLFFYHKIPGKHPLPGKRPFPGKRPLIKLLGVDIVLSIQINWIYKHLCRLKSNSYVYAPMGAYPGFYGNSQV